MSQSDTEMKIQAEKEKKLKEQAEQESLARKMLQEQAAELAKKDLEAK